MDSKNNNKIAVFVDSFDEYRDLWDIFWDIFDMYWNDCTYNKYLVTNVCNYEREGINIIKTGKEVNWCTRTLRALDKIEEDYIILFLEDYFISKIVDTSEIGQIVQKMESEDVFFYRLSVKKGFPLNKGFIEVNEGIDYPISLQLAIWKTMFLKKIINDLIKNGCESPWMFEENLKYNYTYCPAVNSKLKGIRFDTRDIMGYKNGVLRGKWFPDVREYYKNLGIDFSMSKREVLSRKEYIRYKVICYISEHFSRTFKDKVKLLLEKIGIKNTI